LKERIRPYITYLRDLFEVLLGNHVILCDIGRGYYMPPDRDGFQDTTVLHRGQRRRRR
jgi:hypothetical protein